MNLGIREAMKGSSGAVSTTSKVRAIYLGEICFLFIFTYIGVVT